MLAFGALSASAETTDVSALREKMASLRETHAELKAQVEAGEITKDEAKEQWQELIAGVRSEKEALFEARMEKIQEKYESLLETDPERAEALQERIENAQARRAEMEEKRAELKAQVEAGEITRQEAFEIKKEYLQEQREAYGEAREKFKSRREGNSAQ